jgi:two-component system, OmpR family, sensor kinase
MSRRLLRWSLVALIVILAILPLFLIQAGLLPNFLFQGNYQIDLLALASVASVLCGLAAIGFALVILLAQRWTRRQVREARDAERTIQGTAHRRFLHRLDHELKNPLTIIRVGVLNLQHSPNISTEQIGSLTRVAQQARRLQLLVEDLRHLTDLEEQQLEKTAVDLRGVLENAIGLVVADKDQSEQRITLKVQQVPWPLTPALGDPDLLLVAFRNLLDNALKYTGATDQIEVRANEDGDRAVVEIADTGVGIPRDEMAHIFEDLYRGKNAQDIPGSGLGLALVQRIITLHAGTIEVHSRVGQGTVFRVCLPLSGHPS